MARKRRRPKFRRGTKVYYLTQQGKTIGIVVNFPDPSCKKHIDISKDVWCIWGFHDELRHGFMPNDKVFKYDGVFE